MRGVRLLGLTSTIAVGLTLLAMAIAGITALDGRLEAGTPPKPPATYDVSYPEKPPHGCRHHHRDAVQPEAPPPAGWTES